jgi:hypothetical protein
MPSPDSPRENMLTSSYPMTLSDGHALQGAESAIAICRLRSVPSFRLRSVPIAQHADCKRGRAAL